MDEIQFYSMYYGLNFIIFGMNITHFWSVRACADPKIEMISIMKSKGAHVHW